MFQMDEMNKSMADLWQKANILEGQDGKEDLAFYSRLKLILLEQLLTKDGDLGEAYRKVYHSTYFSYRTTFDTEMLSGNLISERTMPSIDDISCGLSENDCDNYLFTISHPSTATTLQRSLHETTQGDDFRVKEKDNKNIERYSREEDKSNEDCKFKDFMTAKEKLTDINRKRNQEPNDKSYALMTKKNLGLSSSSKKFISPINSENNYALGDADTDTVRDIPEVDNLPDIKGIDKKLVELIMNDIVEKSSEITWDDIAGLDYAKKTIEEIVVWPMIRPDLFKGLLGPAKGLLLFGPPGTGKTLIGKCIAHQCKATFFSISASSLTSKWFGEGEKLVRALFSVARHYQPSVVFMDEIDSLLTSRKDGEQESTRRIKTEFLIQLDGCNSISEDKVLIIGATNRPQELDDAARRRFVKRLLVPLPDDKARYKIIVNLLKNQQNQLTENNINSIIEKTIGYSGADMMNLCKEAALGPIRDIRDICNANIMEVRPITLDDFLKALKHVKPSVGANDIKIYVEWNNLYGSNIDDNNGE